MFINDWGFNVFSRRNVLIFLKNCSHYICNYNYSPEFATDPVISNTTLLHYYYNIIIIIVLPEKNTRFDWLISGPSKAVLDR